MRGVVSFVTTAACDTTAPDRTVRTTAPVAATPPEATPRPSTAPTAARARNKYFDLLRALALVRVILYHSLGLAWLTFVFPAVGLMFALGGTLMAASLERAGIAAVGRRVRRLLLPMWVVGLLVVPCMILGGLKINWSMLLWVLPLRNPPVNDWGTHTLGILWYMREYLWFVLLSPLALAAFRRWPVPVMLSPIALLVTLYTTGLVVPTELADLAIYGGCWLVGFAQHEGVLRRMNRTLLLSIVGVLATVGLTWLFTHPGPRGFDINDNALSNGLWSMAFALALMAFTPRIAALTRPRISRLLTVINGRAMTLYLWHSTAIGLTYLAARHFHVTLDGHLWLAVLVANVAALLAVAVVAFGWVEDVAARRRPAVLPG
jgi:peptidoglycan/LPS O-acetylase OafA/YrhL